MDQTGLSEQDLIPFLGSENNVSKVLAGEMALTVPMMRALNEHLGIPAEVLLRQPIAEVAE
jgi:HTH-type transcriptional regulator / antitoxin HigA